MTRTRTIVIGGGVAGLATAGLLAREGHDVHLLERLDHVGGRVAGVESDGFRFETGPSWYLMPEVFEHFYATMGTSSAEQLDLRVLDPAYRIFGEPEAGTSPEVFDVPLGADRVLAAFEEREPGAGRRLRDYLRSGRQALDMALDHFLYNPFTSLRWAADRRVLSAFPRLIPLLTRSLGDHVAARFEDRVLRQILGYPAVFLGTEPQAAPSMYHLMSTLDLEDGVLYPMGGFDAVVESLANLARRNGVRITTGADVTRIRTAPAATGTAPAARRGPRARAAGVEYRDASGERHLLDADVVVSAADLHHTETQLVPSGLRTYPQTWWNRRTSGPGAVLVVLGVRGELPQLAHHSLFFTRDWQANFDAIFGKYPRVPDPASVYVCKPSATDPGVAPAGDENLFVLVPLPADPGIGAGGPDGGGDALVEEVADRVIEQIAAWAQIPDLAERIVVRHTVGPADFARDYHSWRGGILGPGHILRQSAMFRAGNASAHVEGLLYAGGTTTPGVGVPMCLISAELVLKHLRGDSSAGPIDPASVGR